MDWNERLQREVDTLRTMRDELRVQVHLDRVEAQDLWEGLEKRWQHLDGKAHVMADASREALDEIEEAGEKLIDEIRDGYRSLKDLL